MKRKAPFARLTLLAVLAALAVTAPLAAQAAETEAGLVLNIRNGNLERRSQNNWEELAVGDPVAFKQRLKTSPAALAVLELPQIGRYILGPDAEVELGQGLPNMTDNLKKGALWIEAKLPPGNSLTVQTALASSGVRGTKFTVIADSRGMDLCTCKGDVDVTLKDGSVVKVGSGQSCNLDTKGRATGPVGKGQLILSKYNASHKRYGICFECHVKGGAAKKGWSDTLLFSQKAPAGKN
jgi:hypothetical protein